MRPVLTQTTAPQGGWVRAIRRLVPACWMSPVGTTHGRVGKCAVLLDRDEPRDAVGGSQSARPFVSTGAGSPSSARRQPGRCARASFSCPDRNGCGRPASCPARPRTGRPPRATGGGRAVIASPSCQPPRTAARPPAGRTADLLAPVPVPPTSTWARQTRRAVALGSLLSTDRFWVRFHQVRATSVRSTTSTGRSRSRTVTTGVPRWRTR